MTRAGSKRISIVTGPQGPRVWQTRLAAQLRADGHEAGFAVSASPALPASLGLLVLLEGLLYGHKPALTAAETGSQLHLDPSTADLVIDFAVQPDPASGAKAMLRILFDNSAGESALVDALLSRRAPQLTIVTGDGATIASALPALEEGGLFTASHERVAAHALALTLASVRQALAGTASPLPARPDTAGRSGVLPILFGAQTLVGKIAGRLEQLTRHNHHWRIGVRPLEGPSIAETRAWPAAAWRFLPDDGRRYFADPFLARYEGHTYLFCEEFPYATGRGLLSVAELAPDGAASAMVPILEENFHISYPHVFRCEDQWWMIPETAGAKAIRLYRCDRFPDRWSLHATLVEDIDASDATLFAWGGKLWLFAAVAASGQSSWDSLHVFSADRLTGPWRAHPRNPVVVDAGAARPAGEMFVREGALWRPAQDCREGYGSALALCRVDRLDDEDFAQSVATVLRPQTGWNAKGVHTLNCGAGFEAIDVLGVARRGFAKGRPKS